MLQRFLLPALLLLSLNLAAQKVKVKKGIIYLSRVEMYRIVDNGGQNKAILSIEDGDTLVWMNRKRLVNEKASYETERRELEYWGLEFDGLNVKSNYISRSKDGLYKDLIYQGVLSNQSINEAGFRGFEANTFLNWQEVTLLEQAIEQREILAKRADYTAYSKMNSIRTPVSQLEISNNVILFKPTNGEPPAALGKIEYYEGHKRAKGYQIIRTKDQKTIATIEIDGGLNTMSINTTLDKETTIHALYSGHRLDFLKLGIRYLTDAGYL